MDTKRIKIEDTALINALLAADRETEDHYGALVKLAEEVRRHVSGPASCTAVRAAEAERYDVTTSETAKILGDIESSIRRGREELARLHTVCDDRTKGE